MAFGAGSEEVTSHLAELEARELRQVERAMAKIKAGTYGVCEGCSTKIPVERLNALPYSISVREVPAGNGDQLRPGAAAASAATGTGRG